jgi:hypothetical protein
MEAGRAASVHIDSDISATRCRFALAPFDH